MTLPRRSTLALSLACLAAGVTIGATAVAPAGAGVAASSERRVVAVAKLARNADKVDGKHAVGAGADRAARRNKLVATDGSGRLPNDIIAQAPDADRLDGIDGAALRFINLDLGAAIPSSTTTTYNVGAFGTGGLTVPDSGINRFGWSFVLPPSFPTGATMTIRIQWLVGGTGCTVSLRPNAAGHQRLGLTPFDGAATAGLTGPDSVTSPAVASETTETVFTAVPPRDGTQFQAGDSYVFSLFRGADSCTQPVIVSGASITF